MVATQEESVKRFFQRGNKKILTEVFKKCYNKLSLKKRDNETVARKL